MRHGLWVKNDDGAGVERVVDLAVAAEDAGWDGVFVSDSLPFEQYPDPWVLLAAVAARTDEVTLGTWVVPVPRRQPWQLASEVATLDQLSGGRLLLGVGLGNDDDYVAYGTPYEPPALASRLDEALEVVDALWSGEPVDHDGEHFHLEEAVVVPTPVQAPRVPVLAGCWWPNRAPVRRGARWDGIMPWLTALSGGEGPHGETSTGGPMEELEACLDYYAEVADEPGEVVVPRPPDVDADEVVGLTEPLGGTWLLELGLDASADDALETVRAGPPG